MGCTSSKPSAAGNLLELAPARPAAGGRRQPSPHQMTRAEIERNLQQVARFLAQRRQNLRIVAVGGSINTMVLQSRKATHDVDFFSTHLSKKQGQLLGEAARRVASSANPKVPNDWLNNQTAVFLSSDLREQLEREALEQNQVVFSAPGLTVYAAPWMYLFSSKIHRIAGAGRGPQQTYDPHDAYAFLQRYLQLHRRPSISAREVKQFLNRYRIKIPEQNLDAAIQRVNSAGRSRSPNLPAPIQR